MRYALGPRLRNSEASRLLTLLFPPRTHSESDSDSSSVDFILGDEPEEPMPPLEEPATGAEVATLEAVDEKVVKTEGSAAQAEGATAQTQNVEPKAETVPMTTPQAARGASDTKGAADAGPVLNVIRPVAMVRPVVDVYPLGNYEITSKTRRPGKDASREARLLRIEGNYRKYGMREQVEGILLVHDHNHPHVLLLQVKNAPIFKLPGGRLRAGEDTVEGMKRKLTSKLSSDIKTYQTKWDIGALLSEWHRPHFDSGLFPYVPPHITKPKERRRMFLIPLPGKATFAVPDNMKLTAVPLFRLYNNTAQYGPILASLPQLLSRYKFNFLRVGEYSAING